MEMPPLLSSRSPAMQVVVGDLVPAIYGSITGVLLGVSKPVYLILTLLAIPGGLLAGFEHRGAGDGAARGFVGGALFGGFILLAHEAAGTHAKASLPHPGVVLVAITIVGGIALGAIGGALRSRRTRHSRPVVGAESSAQSE
jgi:hypothetical protein